MVAVDIRGGLAADTALAATVDPARRQAARLASPGPCAAVTRPATPGEAGSE